MAFSDKKRLSKKIQKRISLNKDVISREKRDEKSILARANNLVEYFMRLIYRQII